MNDVMKKRLIGVAIIIAIGILVPVLLSKCMGGGDDRQSGDMRVYTVDPDGTANPESDGSNETSDEPRMPDAVSPQREPEPSGSNTSGSEDSDSSEASNEGNFETPPVAGRQESENASSDTSSSASSNRNESSRSQPERSEPSRSSEPAPKPEPAPSSSRNESRSSSSSSRSGSSSGYDYGASTQSRGSSRASSGNTTSGGSSSSSAASGLSRSSISGWVVQVGSFSQQSNASDLARQLSGNFSASYTPVTINGRTLYRVNIGPFSNESQARSAAQQLSNQGRNGLVRNLP